MKLQAMRNSLLMDPELRGRFEAKYGVWKEKLLDLSASNRLLNFRTTKVTTVRINRPDITGLFERLVLAEKSLKFPLYQGQASSPEHMQQQAELPEHSWRVRPGDIETSKSPPDLEKALGRLAQLARTSREERGVNTLYVALGMLEWRSLDTADPQLAPLLMVPVELARESRLEPYILGPFDEDPEVNPSLIYMLRKDFEFSVPEFDSEPGETSLNSFLTKLAHAVRGRGWRVIPEAWLGQFQFKKLAMYKDLEEHSAQAADHNILTAVAGYGDSADAPIIPAIDQYDHIKPSEVFTLRDADGSQLAAILRARAGQNLIVQGPPGTGKSQTIANLIAQFLLDGRKVLFVSEKMAALSVVYKRLQEAGLSPFCLEIHSEKANKRAVLDQIRLARPRVQRNVSPQDRLRFEVLLNQRHELNNYVRALHEPILHNKSAFDIHGELARLSAVPDIVAKLDITAQELGPERESELLDIVRKSAQLPDVFNNYLKHPWFGCVIAQWSMQVQAAVPARFERFRQSLHGVKHLVDQIATYMMAAPPSSLDELHKFLAIVRAFAGSPCPPISWSKSHELRILAERARELANKSKCHRELVGELARSYSPTLFEHNCRDLERSLNPPSPSIVETCRGPEPRKALTERSGHLQEWFGTCSDATQRLSSTCMELAAALDEAPPSTLAQCRTLAVVAVAAGTDPRPTVDWFESSTLKRTIQTVQEASQKSIRLSELRERLVTEFADEFFELPLSRWKGEFENRYRGAARFFRADYYSCCRRLRRARRSGRKVTHSEASRDVSEGAELLETRVWFKSRAEEHSRILGSHYDSAATDWGRVAVHLENVRTILDAGRGTPPPQALVEALLAGGGALRKFGDLGKSIGAQLQAIDSTLDKIREHIVVQAFTGFESLENAPLEALRASFQRGYDQLAQYRVATNGLATALLRNVPRDADLMARDASSARAVQEIEDEYARDAEDLKSCYGHFADGVNTDWDRVLQALSWTGDFIAQVDAQPWKEGCAGAACSPLTVAAVRGILRELEPLVNGLLEEQGFHSQVFDENVTRVNGKPINSADFDEVASWLASKIDNIGGLSQWIRFRELRQKCDTAGIGPFLDQAIDSGLSAGKLEQALKKRLLSIQLDAIYDRVPQLAQFQWQNHEELIGCFRQLDRQLMSTYSNLVHVAVTARQPDLDGPAAGQVGFLRRELAKQKKHAPLRKLFRESGSVILNLTPCLLMSPLSVATFLEKDAVRFDVVLFDEASQVPTEEATGAILRGNQLIVAGDVKQLPPTRFFERSLDDENVDEDAAQATLDSLLEDCDASGMQSCQLLWHYRSKHEGLIAFSNAEFYGNNLITFPTPHAGARAGIGVRLEYVADGVYDRGRSRTNRREAERVAEMIERHCDHWGLKRSVGVIALSTAQEAAIEEEVERLLIRRPDLEELLKPDADEAFFVKPLENVQGDERDTIIISIGYAKDATGVLSLNFGPINSQGGEKRLNVAVTRARWELILVSSIFAHDIDESRVQSVGPKLLRRYLSFAKEGKLPTETAAPTGESESPFELAVWEALRDVGVHADRQVGTSSYRIDLAIKDPERPGRYLLGVECDGARYHSSAIARDRDRLRQQILESLGWKIHRIWSTDWIRDRKGALSRLLRRIEEAKTSVEPQTATATVSDPVRSQDSCNEDFHAERETGLREAEPGDPYSALPEIHHFGESSTPLRRREEFYLGSALIESDAIEVVHREGPIHEDAVVRQVARGFQLKRTGRHVESRIVAQIDAACRRGRIRRKGKFLWLVGMDSVAPRRPEPGVKLREIDHVPPEELESAALLVVRLTHGITEEELAVESARVLGYLRITENIRTISLRSVRRLAEAGALVARGDHLFLADAD